jgi:hypothetical protein
VEFLHNIHKPKGSFYLINLYLQRHAISPFIILGTKPNPCPRPFPIYIPVYPPFLCACVACVLWCTTRGSEPSIWSAHFFGFALERIPPAPFGAGAGVGLVAATGALVLGLDIITKDCGWRWAKCWRNGEKDTCWC